MAKETSFKHLKALDYLRIELEREKQIVEDNPEIKESSKDNIKALEEMIFELVQVQSNHNNSMLLQDIDEKINIIKSRLTNYLIFFFSTGFGILVALLLI